MAVTTQNIKNGGDAELGALTVTSIAVNGVSVVTALLLASGQVADLNGEADALVLDADGNTSISAPTDNQIDIEINGADDFTFTANTFTALTGSTIVGQFRPATQELTATGAVTIANGTLYLNHATVAIVTAIPAPTAGDRILIIDSSASGTAAHVVTLTGATCNVTGNNTLTLNAPDESIELVASSATRWRIIANNNSVGLSTV